jgi:mono/diheme cytochrome c family protein
MRRQVQLSFLLGIAILAPSSGYLGARAATGSFSSNAGRESAATQRALLDEYCVGCHNERQKDNYAGLALDKIDLSNVAAYTETLEKVIRKVRAGQMPPAGRPGPQDSARESLASWLETELDRVAAADPNPGRKDSFHRLNRAEYRNAIRDLLGIDVDVASLLPTDDASYGFDNIAGVLRISQSQLEQYLAAARKISRAALGSPVATPGVREFRVAETQQQYDHLDGLPFGTRGGILVDYHFPRDGDYEIAVDLLCRRQGECDGSAGFPDTHELEVAIDGKRARLFLLEPRTEFRPPEERAWRVRVPVAAGPHKVSVAFLKLPSIREADARIERFLKPHYVTGVVGDPSQMIYQPFVDRVTITGPFNEGAPGDTPSRRAILTCRSPLEDDEAACAKEILLPLIRQAFRRPVTDADLEAIMPVFQARRIAGGGFESGIEAALRRLLVSPEFLFRVEHDPNGASPGSNYRISDLELASRLSFFLWSSIPDDELLAIAARGELSNPSIFEHQVRRMIADDRSTELVRNFAGQWLQLRNLDAVNMDWALFPNFDDGVRFGFRRETELFVESILRENRGIIELLTADYTFINERLARHYGIPGVYGDQFRRVSVLDRNRQGLLGHGSILTVTSRPNRTSPVLRGKWILMNILGSPPPDPPADVPALEEDAVGNHSKADTVRERLAQHRRNPVCAGCHAMIDPPGFALENFDAIGRWREVDDSFRPIDASGVLSDGTPFNGVASFRKALVEDPRRFVANVTEKLLTYALGRGIEPYDMPAVRRIVRMAEPNYRLADVILGITTSIPFQMRQTADTLAQQNVLAPAAQ